MADFKTVSAGIFEFSGAGCAQGYSAEGLFCPGASNLIVPTLRRGNDQNMKYDVEQAFQPASGDT